MFADLIAIGWRPALIGSVVLMIGVIAGWGMAGDTAFTPVHWLRCWLSRIILPGLRSRSWLARAAVIFLNNATVCALLIWVGVLTAGAWAGIVIVGLSLGAAIRLLTNDESLAQLLGDHDDADTEALSADHSNDSHDPFDPDAPEFVDRVTAFGLLLNMLEVPAIIITLGLSMGRVAMANGLSADHVWRVYACWVVPLLLAAASGESLWIGRRKPF